MLETKGLYKIYKPKRGVPVTALRDVSIRFPDKGMVFLLGKSGSGKSTLLNVLGGLDRYDRGEILIKGVSSRRFRQKHFDSYRNTYVGFIFQEYNILEDFTAGANIALALQLQGKKATDEAINAILEQVDLQGCGNRRPNELSGGQKQRVAIARALVKDPRIIMADEPTGALDSATGRQVLETLKRLSADRLVIVVSHDREFAEQYADRIIELADGAVLRDVERSAEDLPREPLSFADGEILVEGGYQLTEEDRLKINQYLSNQTGSVILHRKNAHGYAVFKETDVEKIPHREQGDFKLIRSKLPLKNAFRMGGSGLKYKKFRLVITIFLSCVAFGLFGLSDTFGSYRHVDTCARSIQDSKINYASVVKEKKMGDEENPYWVQVSNGLTVQDLKDYELDTGSLMIGVYDFGGEMDLTRHLNAPLNGEYYATEFCGVASVTADEMARMGCTLSAGRLPQGNACEVVISRYLAESFLNGQYRPSEAAAAQKIAKEEELLGKTLTLYGEAYTVVGIADTGLDTARYRVLLEEEEHLSTAEELTRFALERELNYASRYSLATVAMVSPQRLEMMEKEIPSFVSPSVGYAGFEGNGVSISPSGFAPLGEMESNEIIWLDEPKTVLAENEIVISADFIAAEPEPQQLRSVVEGWGSLTRYGWVEDEQELYLENVRVVGILPVESGVYNGMLVSDELYKRLCSAGDYAFAVGPMPAERSGVRSLVAYGYEDHNGYRFPLRNSVTYQLELAHEVLVPAAKIFLYIGLGFALFAALMLSNFIATSISYKKREIGILRAIGSRSSDVFRIFFSESFIIAMINFVLSSVGVGLATVLVNWILRKNGILISVLSFGLRQILLLLAVSLAVAAVASLIPVYRIAAKRPIDAIRDR